MLVRSNLILKNSEFIKHYNIIKAAECDRKFCKHDLDHLLGVARIMIIQDLEHQNVSTEKDIIYAIALLHDLGRSQQYQTGVDHSLAGSDIAKSILSDCNYNLDEIAKITFVIENHNTPDTNEYLVKLLQYADHHSRNCFLCQMREHCNWDEDRLNKGIEI